MSLNLYVGPDSQPDKYRLVRSVGRGGEATLYLAEVSLAGQTEPVVVKVLNSDVTANEEQFAELSAKWGEQAELLRFINRLGVVGVREHFEGAPEHPADGAGKYTDRALYLVMNYVQGVDLRDWRAEHAVEGPRGQREVLRYLEQVALVLDVLHSGRATPSKRVVVHGDLSPGNVMISDEGQATLVDFGLSRIAARHMTARPWFTPGYAAPEIFNGEYSAATDRYAFGAIVFFALTGEDPPPAPEQLRERFGALSLVANAGERQRELVMSMFSAEPGDRPESSDWIRALRSLATSVPWTGPVGDPGDAGDAVLAAAAAEGPEPSDPSGTAAGTGRPSAAGDPAEGPTEKADAATATAAAASEPPQGGRFSGPPPESGPVRGSAPEEGSMGDAPRNGRPFGPKSPPGHQNPQDQRNPHNPPGHQDPQNPQGRPGPQAPPATGTEDMPPRPVGGMRGAPQSRQAPPPAGAPRGGQPVGPPSPSGPHRSGPRPGQQPPPPGQGAPPQGPPPQRPPMTGTHSAPVHPGQQYAHTGPQPAQPGWGSPAQPHTTAAFSQPAQPVHAPTEVNAPEKRKKSRKPVLIGLAILVVLAMGAGGTATYFVMDRFQPTTVAGGGPDEAADAATEPSETPTQEAAAEPTGEESEPSATDNPSESDGSEDDGPGSTLLTQMDVVDEESSSYWRPETGRAEINGQSYSRAIISGYCMEFNSDCTGWIDYNLGRDWTDFTATIGVDDTSNAGATTTFTVHADGEAVVTETLRLGETMEIEADVTDALRLRIEVESDDSGIYPVWADPTLSGE